MKGYAMRDKTISATEAARSFSEVLNQVQYRDMSFSIERGRRVVARLVPAALPAGLPLADLNGLFAGLPHLRPAEANQWKSELRMRRSMPSVRSQSRARLSSASTSAL